MQIATLVVEIKPPNVKNLCIDTRRIHDQFRRTLLESP